MPPCPCYTVAAPAMLSYSSTCGVCETKIDCQLDDGGVPSAVVGGSPSSEAIAKKNEYYAIISKMKGSMYNCQKTAIAIIYAAYITKGDFSNEIQNIINQLVCWIKNSNAVDGPCAATLISICQMFAGILEGSLQQARAEDNDIIKILLEYQNQTIEAHNCCGFKPFIPQLSNNK